jgi:CheY-like chemotaxis protein
MSQVEGDKEGLKGTIYAVDDEPMLLELASAILRPLGYDIVTFRDPEDALRAFASAPQHPELIITDYAMRTMNGMELIAACRHIEPRQKCLLVSGTVEAEVYRHTDCKPDAFLPKPFEVRELIDAVTGMVKG